LLSWPDWVAKVAAELYKGWMYPLAVDVKRLTNNRDRFGRHQKALFANIKAAERHIVRPCEGAKVRLYHSWEHVRIYHLRGLHVLRQQFRIQKDVP